MQARGPSLTEDELRLRQLNVLIAQCHEALHKLRERADEEGRRLALLEVRAAELRSRVTREQHHLRAESERD